MRPTPYPSTRDPEDLRGFVVPVEGGCLPASDRLMPNAPREYRNGFHEGIDWYGGLACAHVTGGTPVMAMLPGIVIRADLDYVEITIEQINEFSRRTAELGYTEEPILDIYRGRQIWIDHGNGVVTRYAHLGVIAEGIEEGVEVEQARSSAASASPARRRRSPRRARSCTSTPRCGSATPSSATSCRPARCARSTAGCSASTGTDPPREADAPVAPYTAAGGQSAVGRRGAMPILSIEIPWDPDITKIGGLLLTWHGLFTAIGIFAGVRLSLILAKVVDYDYDDAYTLALVGVPSGIVGARALFVIEHWSRFSGDPVAMIRLTEGGISIWGAILGGVGGALAFGLWKGYPIARGLDIASFGIILGQATGRLGDLVNGEHLGECERLAMGRPSTRTWTRRPSCTRSPSGRTTRRRRTS